MLWFDFGLEMVYSMSSCRLNLMLQELSAERIIHSDWLCSIIGEHMEWENYEMEEISWGALQFVLHSFLRWFRLMSLMWNMGKVANEYTFKLRRLRWVEHIAYMGLDRCMHNFGSEASRWYFLRRLSVHGSITLKYILRDGDCDWIGLAQDEVQLSVLMNRDEPSGPTETGHLFICWI
jgi:hypothetical protein